MNRHNFFNVNRLCQKIPVFCQSNLHISPTPNNCLYLEFIQHYGMSHTHSLLVKTIGEHVLWFCLVIDRIVSGGSVCVYSVSCNCVLDLVDISMTTCRVQQCVPPKLVKLTPNETNLGLFQIRFQYILAQGAKMY